MLNLKYHNKNIKYSHFFIFIRQTGPYNESEVKNVSLDYGVDNNLQSCITSVSAGKVVMDCVTCWDRTDLGKRELIISSYLHAGFNRI